LFKPYTLKRLFLFLAPVALLFSCTQDPQQTSKSTGNTLFSLLDSSQTGIDFTNQVENTDKFNIFNYRNFYNGGGVAIGDINNDGLSDVFMTANMSSNKLYLNKGKMKFQDISSSAFADTAIHWSTGVVMVDINNDGWLDIYVCNAGFQSGVETANQLFINNKDLTFTEQAAAYGLDDKGYTTHAAFFDYDKDGDLDAYILNNSFIPVNTLNYSNKRELRAEDWQVKDFLQGGGDKLLRNDNGKFADVSQKAGIYGSLIGFGLGISVGDVNGDLWPDIYISNDFYEKDYLYINQKNGSFKEELEQRMGHISLSSMGSDMADINNDGKLDIFATDMLPSEDVRLKRTTSFESNDLFNLKRSKGFYNQYIQNTLQLNNGDGQFTDIANMAGTEASDWSWGALIFDADNDGWQDLLVCNGIYKDVIDQDFIDFFANEVMQKMVLSGKKQKVDTIVGLMPSTPIPNKMFRNKGDLQYEDVATAWGLDQPGFSNGAAYGDLDNDGDLDLVVSNVNSPCFVYQNNANNNKTTQHFSVRLKGQSPNTFAIGAKVEVYTNGQCFTKEIMPSRGFQSSVDYTQVFGLGKNQVVDSMVVYWPDATRQVWIKPAINQVLVAEMSNQRTKVSKQNLKAQAIFQQVTLPGKWKHKEDEHVDFYYERGLHEMLSKEGPPIAVADLNKDGIDEIFVGAATGQRPVMYWSAGSGYKADTTTFSYTDFEDTAATFFDADGDGDLDLFIGSGGNHHPPLTREMQDRIYLNNANQFVLSTRALPANGMNTSVCIPFDYDNDGDVDLFVGSRSYPQQYGAPSENYLYENNGKGSFQNVAKTVCPELAYAGFVTSATLVDLDGDKKSELVVACTWGEIQAFSFAGKKVAKRSPLLPAGYSGMWSYVSHADLDNDGDEDLVCGNMGLNSSLSEYPLTLWVGDFDANKTVDKIISRQINNRDCPVMMKREFMEQLPSLKKNSLKHEEYAHKTIEDLLPAETRKKAKSWKADYFSSVVIINKRKMQFDVKPLPRMFQTSQMSSAILIDVNKDGFTDIVPIGNRSVFAPQFGRLDGLCGDVIINDKGTSFAYLSAREAGLDLRGDARSAYLIKGKKTTMFMVTFNNSQAKLYAQR
jgi:hypothetical protein